MKNRQTSSLLARNRRDVHLVDIPPKLIEESSRRVQWPKRLDSSKELTQFLFYLLERRGFKPGKPFIVYRRDSAKLVKDFSHEILHEAMLKAAKTAKHAWGFSYVRECIDETVDSFRPGNAGIRTEGAF